MPTTNLKEKINTLLESAYSGRTSDLYNSIALAKEALQISETIGDKHLMGESLNQLSLYHMINSDFDRSNKFSERAILCFNEINDERGIADAKYNIGSVLYKTDNYHGGLVYLLEAQRIYKKYDDLHKLSKVEKAVGTVYEYIGDSDNAFITYINAIRTARKISNVNLESNVFNNLSGFVLKKGKAKIAMQMIEHSIKLKKQTKDYRGLGYALYGRAKIYLETERYEESKKDFEEALKIHKEFKENMGASMSLSKLGKLYFKLGEFNKAEKVLQQSLEYTIAYKISMVQVKNYRLLYLVNKANSKNSEALRYLELYLKEKEAVIFTQTKQVIENYSLINKMNILEGDAALQRVEQKAIDKKTKDEKESVKLKQEFLSIMSHEIRTPLNAITTIASILNDKTIGEDKPLLESLQFASYNLINIVNDVLDFTKLDLKKAELELSSTNLNSFCEKVLNLNLSVANNKGLKLNFNSNVPKDNNYLIDQTKITQILSNLISNAIKFTEKGHVDLNVALIKENGTNDTLLVGVKDTGEGISEADSIKVFDSFSQVKPILTRKQGGTGLGLAIVKKLVALHGSKIKLKSKVNEGSEFYFEIELEKSSQKIETKRTNFYELKDKVALLAEDTPINAMLITRLLKNWSVKVDHVKNGKEAVEFAKKKKYDFILMDIHMPELNGLDATSEIKASKNPNQFTPIFAITADALTIDDETKSKLFDDVLLKPIEIDKLFSALARE